MTIVTALAPYGNMALFVGGLLTVLGVLYAATMRAVAPLPPPPAPRWDGTERRGKATDFSYIGPRRRKSDQQTI